MKKLNLTLVTLTLLCSSCATPGTSPVNIDYFGQPQPGLTPQRFSYVGLGIDAEKPRIPVFTKDGTTVLFNMGTESRIYIARRMKSGWSQPVRASFSESGRNWEPYLMPDQRTLLFGSTRPPGALPHMGRVWRTTLRKDGSWSPAQLAITTEQPTGIWYPNGLTLNEILFSSELPGGVGGSDLWRTDASENGRAPSPLPAPINSEATEWDPYLLPGGDTLLFASNRKGGHGRADLYVTFKTPAGEWGEPRNLGPLVNSAANEVASAVSPDGRFLFFIREPGELYWVSRELIDRLRD